MPAATCRKPAVRRFSRTARQFVPLAADVRGLGTLCGSRSVTDATCGSGAVLRMSVFPVFGLLKGFQRRILHAASRPVAGGGALVKNFTKGLNSSTIFRSCHARTEGA